MKHSYNSNEETFNLIKINDFTYSLKINGDFCNNLYNTIQKFLKTSHLDYETNSIFFSAEKVTPLKKNILDQKNKRLSHSQCIKLIDDLTKQMLYLKN